MTMDEQQHLALPQLYGAPAYARPPRAVEPTERPFDPDDLPLEAVQTDEEREIASTLPARAYAPGGMTRADGGGADGAIGLRPRPLTLRSLAGRILGQSDN